MDRTSFIAIILLTICTIVGVIIWKRRQSFGVVGGTTHVEQSKEVLNYISAITIMFKKLMSIREVQSEFADDYYNILANFDTIVNDAAEVDASKEDVENCIKLMNSIDEIVATNSSEYQLDCKNRSDLIKRCYNDFFDKYSAELNVDDRLIKPICIVLTIKYLSR